MYLEATHLCPKKLEQESECQGQGLVIRLKCNDVHLVRMNHQTRTIDARKQRGGKSGML